MCSSDLQQHAHALYTDPRSAENVRETYEYASVARSLKSGQVLDLGCGVGRLGKVIAKRKRSDIELVGIDITPELLKEATEGYTALLEGDAHHLPFKDNTFDAVILHSILHHAAEPAVVAKEAARVLKPGGILIASDPRYIGFLEAIKQMVRKKDDAYADTHVALRVNDLRIFLTNAGLEIDTLKCRDPFGPLIAIPCDMLKFSKLGLAFPIGWTVNALDRIIERIDVTKRIGLMVFARAHKP